MITLLFVSLRLHRNLHAFSLLLSIDTLALDLQLCLLEHDIGLIFSRLTLLLGCFDLELLLLQLDERVLRSLLILLLLSFLLMLGKRVVAVNGNEVCSCWIGLFRGLEVG